MRRLKKTGAFTLIFVLSIGWIFSGWPQVPFIDFPPEVQNVKAEAIEDMIAYRGAGGDASVPGYRRHNTGDGFDIESTALDVTGTIEWVRLEADPTGTTDEKVLCAKDAVDELDCQVWDGGAWGDLQAMEVGTIGSGNRSFDVCYEQLSGDAFVFYADAGTSANVVYYRFWNGSVWSDQVALQSVGGAVTTIRCVPEPDTDFIAVMAKDTSDDIHLVIWNGSANLDYSEIDADGSASDPSFAYHGAWETSRGDFIAAYYADGDHAIDGSLWDKSLETFTKFNDIIPTGTGGGLIPATEIAYIEMRANPDPSSNEVLLVVHDDDNEIESTFWNGSVWGTPVNLATAISNTTANKPFDLAYEHTSFTALVTYGITTTAIDYRIFSAGSWGDPVDVPSVSLLENSDWQQLAADPHSDRLMLVSVGVTDDVESLEWNGSSWDVSWTEHERTANDVNQTAWYVYDHENEVPTFEQAAYRLFENTNTTDVGTVLAAQNTAATLGTTGAAFRLRLLLHVGNMTLASSGENFKLQFSEKSGTCDTGFSGESYADITDSTVIAFNNNATPADGAALTANAHDPTHSGHTIVNQSYEEANNFTNAAASIPSGQDGVWDFALIDNVAPAGTSYCFRVRISDGSPLDTYTVIPEITTAADSPVYSVSITSSGTVEYGFVELSASSSTVGNGYTQTAVNDGSATEKLNIKSSDAIGGTTWTLAPSIGSDQFKHEFSTTSGSTWSPLSAADTYVTASPSVAVSGTVNLDFRLTAPSDSSDYQQKSITITIQAVAP